LDQAEDVSDIFNNLVLYWVSILEQSNIEKALQEGPEDIV
jgi:hypothetical protein